MIVLQLLACAALLLGAAWFVRGAFHLTVHEHERALLFTRGVLERTLGPGAYWILRPIQVARVLDIRARVVPVQGQEVLSRDNVAVKASLAMRYRITDPEQAWRGAQSYEESLYLEAQMALRDLITAVPVEELLEKRGQLNDQLRVALEPRAAALGLAVETIGLKDITFPAQLRQVFAQVVEARQAAQAALERARGETATLRHLANAAKLLEGNPALVTLKTLQTAGDGRNTLVLGVPQAVVPLPREAELPPAAKSAPAAEGTPPLS
jgi:regulator of protease activity HflC (stomatin/prohibitin superfamily)